jgi:hypothetical protein
VKGEVGYRERRITNGEENMVDEMSNAPPPSGEPAKKERELVIVQSKVREIIRAHDKRVPDEFITALSDQVVDLIQKAIARASANNRSTLRPSDL